MNNYRWTQIGLVFIAALLLTSWFAAPALAQGSDLGDQICTGDNLTLRAGQSANTVLAFGCNVTVEADATVRRDISLFGGNATIAGTVNGSVVAFGGNITVGAGGVVDGDVNTLGGNVSVDPAGTVHGTIARPVRPVRPIPPLAPDTVEGITQRGILGWTFDLVRGIITAIAFAALGALVILFAPDATRRVGKAAQAQPFGAAGVGCLSLIVVLVLTVLLAITIIGIPLAALVGLAAVVAWAFGWIAIGYLAGEKVLAALKAREILPVVATVLGILILALLGQVPILGWLVSLIVGLLGIGAVVLTRFGTRQYPAPPTLTMVPAPSGGGPLRGMPSQPPVTPVPTATNNMMPYQSEPAPATAGEVAAAAARMAPEPGAGIAAPDEMPPMPGEVMTSAGEMPPASSEITTTTIEMPPAPDEPSDKPPV